MQGLSFHFRAVCAACAFFSSNPVLAQAQDEPSTGDDGTTPYTESFTTGDVAPTPPPEGEPDTTGIEVNPELSPEEDFGDGMSEKFMFGFTGALEFPHVINVGFDTLTQKKYGVSLNYGNITRNVGGVDVGMRHADVRFRYHPWEGSFFGGIALGQHMLTGEKTKDVKLSYAGSDHLVPTKVKVKAQANYVAPHIGWFAVWDPGFTIGMDIGWLVPMNATSSVDVSASNLPAGAQQELEKDAEYTKAKADVEDAAEGGAKKSLPFISMIRVGWMF